MMTSLISFVLIAALLILVPGPDTLLVLRNSVRAGRRAGMLTAVGTLSGVAVWMIAAALGLSTLLAASRFGYDILRIAGAAYLIWLGLSSLALLPGRKKPAFESETQTEVLGLRATYLTGLLTNVLNPKVGVFFISFLPAFVPVDSTIADLLVFGGLFVLEAGLWLAFLIWAADRGAHWLRRANIRRWLDRVAGAVLIAFGIRLLANP